MGAGSSKDDGSKLQPSEKTYQNGLQNFETKEEEERLEVKLPWKYEVIVKDADSQIENSSIGKLYEQLYSGVFLNQKRKKYWVEKKSGSNSFMLFARDLLITWAADNHYWKWNPIQETSNLIVEEAELLNVCWLEVHARFDTTMLSPGVLYEVVFVVMLKDPSYGWDAPINLRLLHPNGTKQEHIENLMRKPRHQWIEIPVGEFRTSSTHEINAGEMEISLYEYEGGEWKRGLVIKGVIIRPKN